MIQSIRCMSCVFLLGYDGVVSVWVLISKGRFDWSVAADASISLVMFGEFSRLSNFRSISDVYFRERRIVSDTIYTSLVVGFLVFVRCCLVANLPLSGTSTSIHPCTIGRPDPCHLAVCLARLLVRRKPRLSRCRTLVSQVLAPSAFQFAWCRLRMNCLSRLIDPSRFPL